MWVSRGWAHRILHKVPEPETPVHEEPKWKCGTHNRYKKSCPICKELAGAV